jgi:hypothetical protein
MLRGMDRLKPETPGIQERYPAGKRNLLILICVD